MKTKPVRMRALVGSWLLVAALVPAGTVGAHVKQPHVIIGAGQEGNHHLTIAYVEQTGGVVEIDGAQIEIECADVSTAPGGIGHDVFLYGQDGASNWYIIMISEYYPIPSVFQVLTAQGGSICSPTSAGGLFSGRSAFVVGP